jgi:hypothetical protein
MPNELMAPSGADDLQPAWLTAALADVAGGAVVTDVARTRIGNGMVADSIRLQVTWDRRTDAPTAFVAKVPAAAETSRMAAAATRTYLLEAAFYNELADTLSVHRPTCHFARHEPDTGNYVVLLGDMSPAEAGDQITGCTVAEASAVMPELAALHGPRWDDATLRDLIWLDRPNPAAVEGTVQFIEMLYAGFLERYEERVEPDVLALIHRFVAVLPQYLAYRPEPWTVAHGDFRLDNLLFGGPRVAVLDWQTVKLGPAMCDVAYFLGAGLLVDDRREHEEALVREYHDSLLHAGVDLSWNSCWSGYRRFGFDGLLMGMLAPMLVSRTERGDDMFMAMVNRHGQQVLDLEAESLIGVAD